MGLELFQEFGYNKIFMNRIKSSFLQVSQKVKKFVTARPFSSFIGLLILLVVIVAIGNQLRKPPATVPQAEAAPKVVQVFPLGSTPQIEMEAKIEKSGVIQLVAQSSGIVQKIRFSEGAHVKRGVTLFNLSTNYQGGNIASLNRQVAQRNFNFLDQNLADQKDMLNKQRSIAQLGETQASQLRSITRQSFDETSSLINLDNDIIASMDAQINTLSDTPGATASASLLQTKQLKAQILAGFNAAKQALRSNQYLADDSKEPAQIAITQRDLTLKQLDLQERTLDLNRDLAELNVRINQVNESLMYPVAPSAGTIERIYVKVGQAVTPGTPLASIRNDVNMATAVLLVSQEIAGQLSKTEPSYLKINDQKVAAMPRSISSEPTDGGLFSVIYPIPQTYAAELSNNSFVQIDVPVGVNYANSSYPFIPLDAVYQTPTSASVFVAEKDGNDTVAKSRAVKLGNVYGEYVEVIDGLQTNDQVILDRNVIEKEKVAFKS